MSQLEQLRDWSQQFPVDHPLLWKMAIVLVLLVAASASVRLINRILRRAYWRRLSQTQPERAEELSRSKRQQTLLTLLESLNRYVIYGAAVVLGVTVVFQGAASAVFGASLVVVVVGFGLQRLIIDVVSGVLLLFEGHFTVGDFIRVHQPEAAGIVEEFSLRTTTLRTLGGDRIVLMNGSVTAFTRYANGYREFRLELIVAGEALARERVKRVIERNLGSAHRRFLLGPHLAGVQMIPDTDHVRIELRAVVPPTMEWLCQQSLVSELEHELGDALVGNVDVFNVSETAFEAYRNSILVRG